MITVSPWTRGNRTCCYLLRSNRFLLQLSLLRPIIQFTGHALKCAYPDNSIKRHTPGPTAVQTIPINTSTQHPKSIVQTFPICRHSPRSMVRTIPIDKTGLQNQQFQIHCLLNQVSDNFHWIDSCVQTSIVREILINIQSHSLRNQLFGQLVINGWYIVSENQLSGQFQLKDSLG